MRWQGGRLSYWERQYNPRTGIDDPGRRFDEWRARAARARAASMPSEATYGSHPRERLDLFRASPARGTLVFLHGGYWRAFAKDAFSWIAAPFVRCGVTVVVPSYPLAPQVALAEICRSIHRAMSCTLRDLLSPEERRCVVVAGHSAGAHLAACCAAGCAGTPALAADVRGLVLVSGVFDLLPLLRAEFLAGMSWRAEELFELSPLYRARPPTDKILLAVGAGESREFHRQSERLAEAWDVPTANRLCVTGADHFAVLDALADPQRELSRAVQALFPVP